MLIYYYSFYVVNSSWSSIGRNNILYVYDAYVDLQLCHTRQQRQSTEREQKLLPAIVPLTKILLWNKKCWQMGHIGRDMLFYFDISSTIHGSLL